MRPTISIARWVGGRVALFMLAMLSLPAAAAPLFPEPLHLVRRIEDPISQTVATIDQYCAGNRIVTVRGAIVSVVDYDRGEMMVIDRSNATFKAGASANPSVDPNGGLVRQILHGGLGYDDPIEVANADGSTVRRLYPIHDEAGAGNLQVVVNSAGELVSRSLMEGAYGEDESSLTGAGVDRIAITAKKNATGALESVSITIRLTESIAPATLATGARLFGAVAAPPAHPRRRRHNPLDPHARPMDGAHGQCVHPLDRRH